MGQLTDARRSRRSSHDRRMTTSSRPTESFQIPIEAAELLRVGVRSRLLRPVGADPVRGRRRGRRVTTCSTSPVVRASSPAPPPTSSVRRHGRRRRSQRGDAHRRRPRAPGHRLAAGRCGRAAVRRRLVRHRAVPDGADVLRRPRRAHSREMARVGRRRRHGRRRRPQRARRRRLRSSRSSSWPPGSPDPRRCRCSRPTSCAATSVS